MLGKKDVKGKCPLNKFKECRNDCVLFRRGTRTNDLTNEVTAIELCAFNVIADNIEQMHQRTFTLQQEMGQTKNVMAFHVLAQCGLKTQEESARQAELALLPMVQAIEAENEEK